MHDSMDRPRRLRESAAGTEARQTGAAGGRSPVWLAGFGPLDPPPHARERVLAAMREAARATAPSRLGRAPHWVALAAGLGVVALGAAWMALGGSDRAGAPDAQPRRPATALSSAAAMPTRADLVEKSQQLETVLAALPAQRRLMRADTATTIAALETQIAVIDERLSIGTPAGLTPDVEQLLWRDRVDALNALVQVRYAQSRLFEF